MGEKIELFKQMAELTGNICAKGQDECETFKERKFRCCQPIYCQMTREYAKSQGVELFETGNEYLPFMGGNGCTVAPHLRPVCTLHVCTISWADKSHIEHSEDKTKLYFDLRGRIES